MSYLKKLWRGEPTAALKFHHHSKNFWAAVSLPLALAIVLWPTWRYWVGILLLISCYANWKSDWGNEQATRAEMHADPESPSP